MKRKTFYKSKEIISILLVIAIVASIFLGFNVKKIVANNSYNFDEIAYCQVHYSGASVIFTNSTKQFSVTVTADKDTFPKGSRMQVRDVDDIEAFLMAMDSKDDDMGISKAKGVDITFIDSYGNEVEPKNNKNVDVDIELIQEELIGTDYVVLHDTTNGIVKVATDKEYTSSGEQRVGKREAHFVTDSFSKYIIYAGNTEYAIDNKEYDAVAEGDSLQLNLRSSKQINGTPIESINTVTWESSDTNYITISNTGLITGVKESQGKYITISATYEGTTYTKSIMVVGTSASINLYSPSAAFLQGNDNDGSMRLLAVQEFVQGETTTEPKHIDYDGYVFLGWYDSFTDNNGDGIPESLGNKIDFSTWIPTDSDNIYAYYNTVGKCLISVDYIAEYEDEGGTIRTVKLASTYRIEVCAETALYNLTRDVAVPVFENSSYESTHNIVLAETQNYLNATENENISVELIQPYDENDANENGYIHIDLTAQQIQNNPTLSYKVVFNGAPATYVVNHYKEDLPIPGSTEKTYSLAWQETKYSICHTYTYAAAVGDDGSTANAEMVESFQGFVPSTDRIIDVEIDSVSGIEIDIYYDRSSYNLSFSSVGDYPEQYFTRTIPYGSDITVNADGSMVYTDTEGNIGYIQAPIKTGYDFEGWSFSYQVDGIEVAIDTPTSMPSYDIKATGNWETNMMADYTVIYWMQKSHVEPEKMTSVPSSANDELISNYDYYSSVIVGEAALVGTSTTDLINQLTTTGNPENIKKYNGTDIVNVTYNYVNSIASTDTVKIDGSTIINVYYNREVITLNVNWSGVSGVTPNSDVNHLEQYVGLEGATIEDYYPNFNFDTNYLWTYTQNGTNTSNTYIEAFTDFDNVMNFTANNKVNSTRYVVHFVENEDGTYSPKAVINLSSNAGTFVISHKFKGHSATKYYQVNNSNGANTTSYYNVATNTSSGTRITIRDNRTIQVYHSKNSGYQINMYYGAATGSTDRMGSITDLKYKDKVWTSIKNNTQYVDASKDYEPYPEYMPTKVRQDNTDADPNNDWIWKGWYTIPNPNFNYYEQAELSKLSDENNPEMVDSTSYRVFAVWQPTQCTITFVDNSKDEQGNKINEDHTLQYDRYSYVSESELYDGTTLTPPIIKNTLEGTTAQYIFDGWYYDSSLTVKYEENRMINENITLYAKWKLVGDVCYLVTLYNTNGEIVGYEIVEINAAGTYAVLGLLDVDGNERTGATKRVYVDSDLITEWVTAYLAEDVWIYQVYAIDETTGQQIHAGFLGTSYAEKVITYPTIDDYMFNGYSKKDDNERENKPYQIIVKETDYYSTGTGYVQVPRVYFYYTKSTDIPITINYYLENLDGTFTKVEDDTQIITGDIGETIDITNVLGINYADENKYEHYYLSSPDEELKTTVSANYDDNVVNVYYKRNYYTVTYRNLETRYTMYTDSSLSISNNTITKKVKYGDTVRKPEFVGRYYNYNINYYPTWYRNYTTGNYGAYTYSNEYIFPQIVTQDITLYASWSTNAPSSVKIEVTDTDLSTLYNGQNQSIDGYFGTDAIEVKFNGSNVTNESITWSNDQFIYTGTAIYNYRPYYIEVTGTYNLDSTSPDCGTYDGEIVITSYRYGTTSYNITNDVEIYESDLLPGKLSIIPMPLEINTLGKHKEYDGAELTNYQGNVVINSEDTINISSINETSLVNLLETDVLNYTYTGSQTVVGSSENSLSYTITREGVDVSGNYLVTENYGLLEVEQAQYQNWTPVVTINSVDVEIEEGNTTYYSLDINTADVNDVIYVEYNGVIYPYDTRNPRFKDVGNYEMKIIVENPNYDGSYVIETYIDEDGNTVKPHVRLWSNVVIPTPTGISESNLPYIIIATFGMVIATMIITFVKRKREE